MTRIVFSILLVGLLALGACQCSDKPEQPPVETARM